MPLCVTDVSLRFVSPQTADAPLRDYAAGLLALGVARIELPVAMWPRLRGAVPADRVSLAAVTPEEVLTALKAGVAAVAVDTPEAAGWTGQPQWLAVCARVRTPDEAEFAAARLGKLFGTVRLCGLDGAMAEDYAALFGVLTHLGGVSLLPGDALGLGTAAALEWALAGGAEVCCAFRGMGGCAPLEQVLAALAVAGGAQPKELETLPRLCAACTALTGNTVPPHAPVVGGEIFTYESGIHADGIRKDPKNYEPFAPETVGGTRRLSIGKHSGKAALREKLRQMGVVLDEPLLAGLNEQVRTRSTGMRRGFTDEELLALARALRGGA